MTDPALPAVLALHQLFSTPENLDQFTNINRALVGPEPASLHYVFLYASLPKLVANIAWRTPEHFSRLLTPDCRCSPNDMKENLAHVQSGLIELLRRPEVYALALKHCPALEQLLAIPAFGWRAYDELLNAPSARCFGERVRTVLPRCAGRGTNRFDTRPDGIDAIFITPSHLSNYMERLPLDMPKTPPATFGDELKALDQIGLQALRLFERCRQRGSAFHDTAPASMRHRFHSAWRQATPYDTQGAPVAADMSVFEKFFSLR